MGLRSLISGCAWRGRVFGVVGLALLVLAGVNAGFIADLTAGWDIGGRYRHGRDDGEYFALTATQFWLFLLPGMILAIRRGMCSSLGALLAGYGLWIGIAELGLGLDKQAAWGRRWGLIAFSIIMVAVMAKIGSRCGLHDDTDDSDEPAPQDAAVERVLRAQAGLSPRPPRRARPRFLPLIRLPGERPELILTERDGRPMEIVRWLPYAMLACALGSGIAIVMVTTQFIRSPYGAPLEFILIPALVAFFQYESAKLAAWRVWPLGFAVLAGIAGGALIAWKAPFVAAGPGPRAAPAAGSGAGLFWTEPAVYLVALVLIAGWGGVTLLTLRRRQQDKAVAGRKRPCLHCGYELEGLPTLAPCPECGKPPPWLGSA